MGTRTISTKLAIEGEAQYRQSVAACNAELSTMKSNLALVESEFRNNANSMEALTAKGSALDAMYDAQQKKISTLEEALRNAQQAQEAYSSRVSEAQANIQRYEQEMEALRRSTGDTSKEQAELTKELDKWNAELSQAQAGQAAAEQGVQRWQKQLNNAKIELNSLSDKIAQNGQYLREAEQSADGCAHSIDQYGKKVKEAGEASEEFAQSTQQSTQGIEQLAAALAAAGVAKSVKEIADTLLECAGAAGSFETAMAKVSTLVDTSVYSLGDIRAQLAELSGETGVAVGSLAEAAYQALSAGVDAANVVDFVATATKTSVAGFTDSATAVDVLTTAINAYKLEGSDAERVASMLVKTQDEGKTSVGELAQNMGRVIPVAAAYNVSLGNLTTAYALLTKSGTNTRIATTNLSALFTELAKDGSTVADILKEETGKSFAELMASGQELGGIMEILADSVDGDATAFSNLWGSTTAGQAALSLLNSGAEEFTRTLDVMENSSGAVERNFQTMADTTEFAHQRMANAAQNLKIAIGDQLNPALEELYTTGADAFTWATEFVEEHPWVVSAVTGVAAALGALAIGAAGLAAASTAVGALSAALGLLSANPIVVVAAAVVGLVTAVNAWRASVDDADGYTVKFAQSLKDSKAAYEDLLDTMSGKQADLETVAATLKRLLQDDDKDDAKRIAIQQLIDQLNEGLPELALSYDAVTDSINMETEAIDAMLARSADQEKHNAQRERLTELYAEQTEILSRLEATEAALGETREENAQELPSYFDIAVDYNNAINEGSEAVGAMANNERELNAALEANAAEIEALEKEVNAYAQQQGAAAQKAQEMEASVDDLVAQIKELETAYAEGCQAAYDSISSQIGLFEEMDGKAKTSIDKLISTLEGQVKYMDDYAANLQKAMEMGVDEGLVRKLSDGSEESAQILDAIVKGGEKKVAELNEQFAKVEEGKIKFSETVWQMETEFEQKMAEFEQDAQEMIAALDAYEEAQKSGENTMQGYIDGIKSMRGDLSASVRSMADVANRAWMEEMDEHSPSKVFYAHGQNTILGVIGGVEAEKDNLVAAYEDAAKAALGSMVKCLPSDVMKEYQAAYEDSYKAAMKTLDAQLGLFNKLDGTPKTTIGSLIDTLKGQVEYMDTYAANIQKAMEMGVDEGLVQKLSDGKEESAQILAAIVGSGQTSIGILNEQFAKVEKGKEKFSSTIAEMELDFSRKMEAVNQDLSDAMQEMDRYEEAYRIGQNNLQGMIDGSASKLQELVDMYARAGAMTQVAYKREVDQNSPSKKFAEIGRFDIQGIIEGAEAEKQNLAAAYEEAAQAALVGMARHLPSMVEEPPALAASAAAERRMRDITAAAVNAISGIVNSGSSGPMTLNIMFPDGTKFASYYFDPMTEYAKANGTPILNPIT